MLAGLQNEIDGSENKSKAVHSELLLSLGINANSYYVDPPMLRVECQ